MVDKKKAAGGPSTTGGTSVRRKRRSSEEILERLRVAAEEEFRRSGYAGATTAAIARRADVTEAQLFRYFSSKAELFHEAIFKPLSEHVVTFSATHMSGADSAENFREAARLYITEMQNFINDHAEMLMSLLVAQAYPPGVAQGVGQIDPLQDYFERAADLMRTRADKNPQVDPRLMVRVSFAAIMGGVLFKHFLIPQGLAKENEISAAIVEFVLDGISVKADPTLEKAERKKGAPAVRRRGSAK